MHCGYVIDKKFAPFAKASYSPLRRLLQQLKLTPGLNGRHFTDDIFRCISMKFYILIKISLKFVPKGPIDNKLVLF